MGVTEVPRTLLMQKRKKPTIGQNDHDVVKVEKTSMEEYEDMEENLDINVEHAQAVNCDESPLEFEAPETKKRKHRIEINLNLPCDVCGKRFPNKRRLEVHKIIHTDKKPYQCDQCDRAFNQPANLSTHKKKMHYNRMDTSGTGEVQEEADTRTTVENIEENEESDNVETLKSKLEEDEEVVDLDKVGISEESEAESK